MEDRPDWNPQAWPVAEPKYEVIDCLPARWLRSAPFFTGSVAIRRDLLRATEPKFPAGENYGEDIDLWFRVAAQAPIVLSDQSLVAYRRSTPNGLITTANREDVAPSVKRMHLAAEAAPAGDANGAALLRFVTHEYISHARVNTSVGKRARALDLLLTVWKPGLRERRWWVSILMALCVPRSTLRRWQNRRMGRAGAAPL